MLKPIIFAIFTILYFCIRNGAGFNKTACHRLIPTYGEWFDEPPFWIPHGCKTQAFDVKATQKCMSGRTLYVIGNSVPRQSAFGMVEMLGGGSTKREGHVRYFTVDT